MDQLVGTLVGRWYVTLFGITFFVAAVRHLGRRTTLGYAVGATAVGVLVENASVRYGVPYTRYSFEESLRGEELWVGDVPLMVSLSYTFMGYFAFATARLVASGPLRTRGRTPVLEFVVAVVLSTWALWVVDPVSRLGAHFFLGELFRYDGPGFWFGLPLGSQAGFLGTSVVLVGLLTWLARGEQPEDVARWSVHPRWLAVGGFLGQVAFMGATAAWVGATADDPADAAMADALAGAAVIIFAPVVLLVAVQWRAALTGRRAGPATATATAADTTPDTGTGAGAGAVPSARAGGAAGAPVGAGGADIGVGAGRR